MGARVSKFGLLIALGYLILTLLLTALNGVFSLLSFLLTLPFNLPLISILTSLRGPGVQVSESVRYYTDVSVFAVSALVNAGIIYYLSFKIGGLVAGIQKKKISNSNAQMSESADVKGDADETSQIWWTKTAKRTTLIYLFIALVTNVPVIIRQITNAPNPRDIRILLAVLPTLPFSVVFDWIWKNLLDPGVRDKTSDLLAFVVVFALSALINAGIIYYVVLKVGKIIKYFAKRS